MISVSFSPSISSSNTHISTSLLNNSGCSKALLPIIFAIVEPLKDINKKFYKTIIIVILIFFKGFFLYIRLIVDCLQLTPQFLQFLKYYTRRKKVVLTEKYILKNLSVHNK